MEETFTPEQNGKELPIENSTEVFTKPITEAGNTLADLVSREVPQAKEEIPDELLEKKKEKKQRKQDIDKQIRKREAKLSDLETRIENIKPQVNDYEAKKEERDKFEKESSSLKSQIEALNNDLQNKNNQVTSLNGSISGLIQKQTEQQTQNASLNDEITSKQLALSEVNIQVDQLQKKSDELNRDLSLVTANRDALRSEIIQLTSTKNTLETDTKRLRAKYDLFSKDLVGIAEQNKSQRTNYIWGACLSSAGAIGAMGTLIGLMQSENLVPTNLFEYFKNAPTYIFYESILVRASILGGLIFIVLIFINLTRGFLSQLIRTQDKMTSITVLDFMVSRLDSGNHSFANDEEKKAFQNAVLIKQVELLRESIPTILKDSSSNFDKITETKSPIEHFNPSQIQP